MNVSSRTIAELLLIIAILAIAAVIFNIYIKVLKKIKIIRELNICCSNLITSKARKHYIQTKSQNYPPHYEEQWGTDSENIVKENLITFFMKNVFDGKKKEDRFYLVLADSGMGKTTFMIKLYIKYTALFNFEKKYKIKLCTFGSIEILEEIKKIKPDEAKKTILLLDAFDEYEELFQTGDVCRPDEYECFKEHLAEVIHVVKDFHRVVITSHIKYFLKREDEVYEIKITTEDESEVYTLKKMYISPFNNDDIKKYLNKKYGILRFWNFKKRKTADNIVRNSPKLMGYPMFLSYMDFLIEDNKVFKNTYEIYEAIVENWLNHEATKFKHNFQEREKFKENLHKYLRFIAVEIYKYRKQRGDLCLTADEVLCIVPKNNINLKGYEPNGQSLLAHDANGNWKFVHKSILEFMIAREIIENIGFLKEENLEGMYMTEQFIREKDWDFAFIRGGTYLMGSPEDEFGRKDYEKQHPVEVDSFFMSRTPVTIEQFGAFVAEEKYVTEYINWQWYVDDYNQDDTKHPMIQISWDDAKEYCKWLSKKLSIEVRLPTAAEWEYACRAGTTTPFNTGEILTTEQANYDGNYLYGSNLKGKFIGKTSAIRSYLPNAWGLYDMHGNVWEWCEDWYDENYYCDCEQKGIVKNPTGSRDGSYRIVCGGAWNSTATSCRSAGRNKFKPTSRSLFIGFRICSPCDGADV